MPTIQDQNFGVEIEIAGAPRAALAQAVAAAIGGRIAQSHTGSYDATVIHDPQGRSWQLKNDGSIAILNGTNGSELVTPVLSYSDIEMLLAAVRAIKAAGGIPHKSTAIHIHVDGRPHTPKSLSILAKMVFKNEDMIFDALNVLPERRARYTRPMEIDFIEKVARRAPRNDRHLNEYWFGRHNANPEHYEHHRYHGLNLNNLWRDIRTIEFRYFNGSLNPGKIKSYIQFVLALSAKALNARAASHKKISTDNPKFNFRVWLVATLGMNGDEFKTARHYLTKNLVGNSAWRYGRPNATQFLRGEER
jgi:hypothetical protein